MAPRLPCPGGLTISREMNLLSEMSRSVHPSGIDTKPLTATLTVAFWQIGRKLIAQSGLPSKRAAPASCATVVWFAGALVFCMRIMPAPNAPFDHTIFVWSGDHAHSKFWPPVTKTVGSTAPPMDANLRSFVVPDVSRVKQILVPSGDTSGW